MFHRPFSPDIGLQDSRTGWIHSAGTRQTEEELAALVAVLASASSAPAEPREAEQNLWGHPVDRLRYTTFSWQRVTLQERTHMRK